MTNAALLAPLMLLAACITDGIGAEPATPATPIAARATTLVEGHDLIVATGGALAVRIDDPRAIGLEGSASAGYTVEPYELVRWPNTISPAYKVRAHVAGTGSFEIVTSQGIATGLVHSADLAQIALVPAHYELDGTSPFALAANRTAMQVALTDAAGRRLVDATLGIGGATAAQTTWDTAELAGLGHHALALDGDAIGVRELAIDVVAGADRVEAVQHGDRTCFHAYAGATEVAIAMTITGGTPDPRATNCARAADASALRVAL